MKTIIFQMDQLSSLHPISDSSMIIIRSLLIRGADVYYYTVNQLMYNNESVMARGRKLYLHNDIIHQHQDCINLNLADADIFSLDKIRLLI